MLQGRRTCILHPLLRLGGPDLHRSVMKSLLSMIANSLRRHREAFPPAGVN
jgi:hypothetical protein